MSLSWTQQRLMVAQLDRDSPRPVPFSERMTVFFGRRFDDVRVSAGGEARRVCAALGVDALTVDGRVAFRDRHPSEALVAHELVHVIQQAAPGSAAHARSRAVGMDAAALEREAAEAACVVSDARVFGGRITRVGPGVGMQFCRGRDAARFSRHGRFDRASVQVDVAAVAAQPIIFHRVTAPVQFIVGEMRRNAQSSEVMRIRELMQDEDTRLEALEMWRAIVTRGGPWDHKDLIQGRWGNWTIDDSDDRLYFFDIWSNVHYGYVGLAAQLHPDLLLGGAGAAQVLDGTSAVGNLFSVVGESIRLAWTGDGVAFWRHLQTFDDPLDQNSIRLGIALHVDAHNPDDLTTDMLLGMVRRYRMHLSTTARHRYRDLPWWALNAEHRTRWSRDRR